MGDSKPSVALIILDTARSDMTRQPALLDQLPAMRRFFDRSYVFTRAYAPSHWTLPSHASMFTGKPPREHLARPPYMRLREDVPTVAEIFRAQGYRTACVTCNAQISTLFGMTRGFEIVWGPPSPRLSWFLKEAIDFRLRGGFAQRGSLQALRRIVDPVAAVVLSSPWADNGARAATRAVRRLVRRDGGPLFLTVNLMEAHNPYYGRGAFSGWQARIRNARFSGGYRQFRSAVMGRRFPMADAVRRNLSGIYWENVRYLDSQLDALLGTLPSHILDEGYVVVVSDHGQLLGEKGRIDHVAGLDEALIRVPLAVRPPRGMQSERIEWPVDITQLFFLLRAIASDEQQPLASWLAREGERDAVFSEASGGFVPHVIKPEGYDPRSQEDLYVFKAEQDHPAIACVADSWKLICHVGRQGDEVYNVETDAGEEDNLVSERGDILERLHQKLRERFLEGTPTPRTVRKEGLPSETKEAIATVVLAKTLEVGQKPVLVWTGGKDSTVVLHMITRVAGMETWQVPPVLFIDHGQHFPETWSFVREVVERQNLDFKTAANDDLLAAAGEGAETLSLRTLNAENREEALRAGLEGTDVPLSLNTPVGNHLLKTVPLKRAIRDHGFDMVITGIRWDENPARSTEVFFSPREKPPHTRVHPILPWSEREVWEYALENELPIHPLYRKGYRSFDGVKDSAPTDTRPAWEQDLEATEERRGRGQDKEKIMERLRALGYF